MKSVEAVRNQINGLVSGIRECNFIPWQDKLDITQDTWVKIIQKLNEGVIVDDATEIRGYVFQTLRNFCLAYHRKEKKYQNIPLIWDITQEEPEEENTEYINSLKSIVRNNLANVKYNEKHRISIERTFENVKNDEICKELGFETNKYKYFKHGLTKMLKADLTRKPKYVVKSQNDLNLNVPCYTSTDVKVYLKHLTDRQIKYIIYNRAVSRDGYYVEILIPRKRKNE